VEMCRRILDQQQEDEATLVLLDRLLSHLVRLEERRLRRDIAERGRTEESVIRQFNNQVEPMHARYVEPSKAFADLVLSGLEAPEKRARAINRVFSRCQAFLGSEVS